jgi:hypothetical protein
MGWQGRDVQRAHLPVYMQLEKLKIKVRMGGCLTKRSESQ